MMHPILTFNRIPAAFVLALAACGAPADDAGAAREPAPRGRPGAPRPAHAFAPVRVGDTVAGLRITRMNIDTAYDGHPVGSVWFAGEARLRGRYQPHPDSEVHALCFFADAASAARLPRFARDARRAWLCFANQEEARRLLRVPPDTGRAAIVVDGFAYHFSYSDAYNQARLVRVEGSASDEDAGPERPARPRGGVSPGPGTPPGPR